MAISVISSFISRLASPSAQAKTQKGAFGFSRLDNQSLDMLLYDIKNNSDFQQGLN